MRNESVEHILVECDAYESDRKVFMEKVIGVIGRDSWEKVIDSWDHGVTYILGFNGDCPIEITENCKRLLIRIWSRRGQLLSQLTLVNC